MYRNTGCLRFAWDIAELPVPRFSSFVQEIQ